MNAIKSIRNRMGLTQTALAQGIGCTQGNIGHYENKGQTIPPDVARRLITFAAGHGVVVSFNDIYMPELAQAPAVTESNAMDNVARGVANAAN